MLLCEIRKRAILAQKNLEEIKPHIKCYMVVSINGLQFIPSELTAGSLKLLDLLKHPKIFLPGQDLKKLMQVTDKIKHLKNAKPDRPENGRLIHDLFANFETGIETCEFYEPQCELRFYSLDMKQIQKLKEHPIVRRIGKTEISAASIRVVVG
ncbi:MAG TPA: hypothetical protein VKF42_12300 [Chitinivibrionales bacterium]|jgi:hypothetical protein|nr:hypothetical protein [Chitinivibrionales bacterium]